MKLILNRVKGATSFYYLKSFENKKYNSYKKTAVATGLIGTDLEIFKKFYEACSILMLYSNSENFCLGF